MAGLAKIALVVVARQVERGSARSYPGPLDSEADYRFRSPPI
jgi:hypothetical protein